MKKIILSIFVLISFLTLINCKIVTNDSLLSEKDEAIEEKEDSIEIVIYFGEKKIDKVCKIGGSITSEGVVDNEIINLYYDENFTNAYDGSPLYVDTVLYAKYEENEVVVKIIPTNLIPPFTCLLILSQLYKFALI